MKKKEYLEWYKEERRHYLIRGLGTPKTPKTNVFLTYSIPTTSYEHE